MAEKDIAQKSLEQLDDVFADIANFALFVGKEVIKADELRDLPTDSPYVADSGKLRGQVRDVAKFWTKGGEIRLAFIGLENQSSIDEDMPLRVISYDGAAYRSQLNDKHRPRYPVITLVLYFGTKRRWQRPRSLYESLDIPDELKPFVSDYKINVVEIAYLTDEQIAKLKSDFRIIADYLMQVRRDKNYVPPDWKIKHSAELSAVMSALTADDSYARIANKLWQEKSERGNGDMTAREVWQNVVNEYLAKGEAKGEARGEARGEAIGEARGKIATITDFISQKIITLSKALEMYPDLTREDIINYAKENNIAIA